MLASDQSQELPKGHVCPHEQCKECSEGFEQKSNSTCSWEHNKSPESSGAVERRLEMQECPGGIPSWVPSMIGTTFFNACPNGHEGYRKNECTFFCTDCASSGCRGLCQHCVESHLQKGHHTIQIRRYVYCDVVRATDINPHMDISGVQVYTVNQAKVVFLNHRPQSKPGRPSASDSCRTCFRQLREGCSYCSLACKVKAVSSGEGAGVRVVLPAPDQTGWESKQQQRGQTVGLKRSLLVVSERAESKKVKAEVAEVPAEEVPPVSGGGGRSSSANSSGDEGVSGVWSPTTATTSSVAHRPRSLSKRELKTIRAMALPMKRGSSVSSLESLQMHLSLTSMSSGLSTGGQDIQAVHSCMRESSLRYQGFESASTPKRHHELVQSSSDSEDPTMLCNPASSALDQLQQVCNLATGAPSSPALVPDSPAPNSRRKQGKPLRSPVA